MSTLIPLSKIWSNTLLTVCYVLFSLVGFAQTQGQNARNNSDDYAQFNELKKQVKYIFDYKEDADKLDSMSSYILNWSHNRPVEIQLEAIYGYFEHSNFIAPKSINEGERALLLSQSKYVAKHHSVLSRIYLGRAFLEELNIVEAERVLNEAQLIAVDLENSFYLGFVLLEKGELYRYKDQNKLAIRHYLDAMNLAEEQLDDSLYYLSCEHLSNFFFDNKINSKAISYSQLILENAVEKGDSNTIYWTLANIQKFKGYTDDQDFEIDHDVMDAVISYGDRTNNKKLSGRTFAIYRTVLTSKNKFEDLRNLCLVKYPVRFEELKQSQYHLYCRIRALIYESHGQTDSAFYFFNLAKIELEKETNQFMIAHFYQRYGEFLFRNQKTKEAIVYFKKALLYFSARSYELRSEQVSKSLELAYQELGLYPEAYQYSILSREYFTAYLSQLESEELLNAEHDHEIENRKEESAQAEILRKKESENERKKRLVLTFGLALFLFLSGLSYYQFRLTRKERNKSNDLLLNILPEATAEELKTKGKTTAKRYENVSVLFSDIKGFTLISEKLSPEDLVHELDIYFTRFDEIAKANGLEKIKTIGDAYLAVGGLPEGNSATAQDVVKCALEIMEYTKKVKAEKEKLGLPFFEIRVGINTGPVVAGVVGRDKFQYDIWGDAVNVAARMEQTSEVGKINVSKSTYLEIKDKCKCHFRGRLNAKNKGEIEMYFVDMG